MTKVATSRAERACEALVEHLPGALQADGFLPDVCILATRAATLALAQVGIPSQPLACKLMAFSPKYVRLAEAGTLQEAATSMTPEEARQAGIRQVTIGDPAIEGKLRPDGRRGFNAHLVALVEGRFFLDLTLDQVRRGLPGLDEFGPFYFEPPQEILRPFLARERPLAGSNSEGGALRYERVATTQFLQAPDWKLVNPTDRIVRRAVRHLREVL